MTNAEHSGSAREKLERLLKYLEFTPHNLNLLVDTITTAFDAQDLETAQQVIDTALTHYPDVSEIHAHAGLLNLQLHNFVTAREHLAKATAAGLTDSSVVYNLAYSQYQLHEFEAALATLDDLKGAERHKKNVTLLSARCKHNSNKLTSGITELQKLLTQQAEDTDAQALLALMLCDHEEPEKALVHANKALDVDPENFDALLARASALTLLSQFNSAYDDFAKATSVNPHSGRALSGMAQINFYNFEFDSALENLQHAVQNMPNHIGTWHLLGWSWLMKENYNKAREAFEISYELDRNFGETHGALASVYALTDDLTKAERHIKLAKRLAPNGFGYIYANMVMLNRTQKQSDALSLFEQVKRTHHPTLGTTPGELIENRMQELAKAKGDKQKP